MYCDFNLSLKRYVTSKNNGVPYFKTILKNLVEKQMQNLIKEEIPKKNRGHNVNKVAQKVVSSDLFQALDKASIDKVIETLEISVKELLENSKLIKSVFPRNFADQLIQSDLENYMPFSYDALVVIFTYSDETFRQHHFHELMDFYYKTLKNKIDIERINFEEQVKILLPVVKFETATKLAEKKEDKEKLGEILDNIFCFLKHPLLNKEDIFEVVGTKLADTNYILLSYELVPLNQKNGHLGDYFKLGVKVNYANEGNNFAFFVKFLTPKSAAFKELIQSGPSKKEDFFYNTYIPLLKEYGLESLTDFAPKCYFSRLNDVLVLDDMCNLGFVGLTPNNLLEFDALKLVITALAKLHACSFIVEHKMSKKAGKRITLKDDYEEYLEEALLIFREGHFLKTGFDATIDCVHYIVGKFPELTAKFSKQELENKVNRGFEFLFRNATKSNDYRNALCHGDMYVANMLFKIDQNSSYACIIDFQILRYCPPVADLLFFLYASSSRDTRDTHMMQLLEIYYQEVSQHLINFELDAQVVYPKEDFENSVKFLRSHSVFQALFYTQIVMMPAKLRENIFQDQEKIIYYLYKNRRELVDICFASSELYKSVQLGLVNDFVDMCKNNEL